MLSRNGKVAASQANHPKGRDENSTSFLDPRLPTRLGVAKFPWLLMRYGGSVPEPCLISYLITGLFPHSRSSPHEAPNACRASGRVRPCETSCRSLDTPEAPYLARPVHHDARPGQKPVFYIRCTYSTPPLPVHNGCCKIILLLLLQIRYKDVDACSSGCAMRRVRRPCQTQCSFVRFLC